MCQARLGGGLRTLGGPHRNVILAQERMGCGRPNAEPMTPTRHQYASEDLDWCWPQVIK